MWFFCWLGIAFMAALLVYLLYEDWHFFSRPRRAVWGTVVDHQRTVDDGSEFFAAKVRFTDDKGNAVEFADSLGRTERKPHVGKKVKIVYPIGLPQKARVARRWQRPLIYAFVVGTITILSAVLLGYLK